MWERDQMAKYLKDFEASYGNDVSYLLDIVHNPANTPTELLIHDETIGSFALKYKLYKHIKSLMNSNNSNNNNNEENKAEVKLV